jgi:hypothetical protein
MATPQQRLEKQKNRGGVHSGATPLGEIPPSADRQDHLPAPFDTSDPLSPDEDPISLAGSIPITAEPPFIPVSDTEVDAIIKSSSPWKVPDRYGIQMGFVQRGYSVLCDWIRPIFIASVALNIKPTLFKSNVATPVHKVGKKDKTSPKAWRHVRRNEQGFEGSPPR